MEDDTALTQKESFSLYEKARARAMLDSRWMVIDRQIDAPEEVKREAVRAWLAAGWFTSSTNFNGCPGYLLPEAYRSYLPGALRAMSPDELSELLTIAREHSKADGNMRISSIPREGLWRLIDAGIVHDFKSHSSHKYVLDATYR